MTSDKKLRTKIKNFLRGKIAEKKEVLLKARKYPFAPMSLRHYLSKESMARLYFTEFKRKKTIRPEFFGYCDDSFPGRSEVFAHIVPKLVRKNTELNCSFRLTTSEFNQLLAHENFRGNLKKLEFETTNFDSFPENLLLHKETLKKLDINFRYSKIKFPSSIYECTKLTYLKLLLNENQKMTEGISKLQVLKQLDMYLGEEGELPKDFAKMPKFDKITIRPAKALEPFKLL